MYPNDLNVMEAMWRSVRIYIVEKNGKLCDKFDRNIDLICEYDPQGMKMKIFTGKKVKPVLLCSCCSCLPLLLTQFSFFCYFV